MTTSGGMYRRRRSPEGAGYPPVPYAETYGGGRGTLPAMDGAHAVHTHMTNTRNTPCEVIEREYPLRVLRHAIARGTGGRGRFADGDGLVRKTALPRGRATAIVATARVDRRPWGLAGGEAGQPAQVRLNRAAMTSRWSR
jgi:N-methylhydantoinase B